MKRINQKYFTIGVYALGVIAVSVLFLLFALNFRTVFSFLGSTISALSSILYGILLAFLLLPMAKRFDVWYGKLFCKKRPRPLLVTIFSIVTTYLIALIIFGVTVGFIIPALIQNIREFASSISLKWDEFGAWAESQKDTIPFLYGYYEDITALLACEALPEDTDFPILNFSSESLIGIVTAVLSGIVSRASNIFMCLIISVYLLSTRRVISGICGKLVVALIPKKSVVKFVIFFKRLYTDFCAFSSSRFLVVFLCSVLIFLFCWILNIPMFSILVVILLISHLIPAVGPVAGDLIAVLLALLLSPIKGLFFMLFLIGIEILAAKVAFPLVTPKKLRPSFALTAVLVLTAWHFLGPIGAFAAVPLFATLNIEFRELLAHRLAKNNMPISTEIYEKTDLEELSRMRAEGVRKKKEETTSEPQGDADTQTEKEKTE
ncbi:MAG: AI-2E family transporter [Clostridia bacterium]|nr:AI-2E family transporter [Clostridia bacterium]